MKLPLRLERIVGMVPPCRTACDIGCDHAYTAIELVKRGRAERVLACDVREGPLRMAERNVALAGLKGQVELRLGDGLTPVRTGEAETVVIAGMGGELMCRILRDRLRDFRWFVLSPHSDMALVRHLLCDGGLRIVREEMLREDGKYYTVLLAEQGTGRKEEAALSSRTLASGQGGEDCAADNPLYRTEADFCYGGLLIEGRDPVLWEFLIREKARYGEILRKTDRQEVQEAYALCLGALRRMEYRKTGSIR